METSSKSAQPPIVAMDGPSGVGKSTAARDLAQRLGVPYVDTGAMYRAIALSCLRAEVDLDDGSEVSAVLKRSEVAVDCVGGNFRVYLEGEVLGDEIRSADVSLATSRISVHGPVRERLVELQRDFGRRFGGVFEGRDIGSVVFPRARHKFFMEASASVRARRRFDELAARGDVVELGELEEQMRERDVRDQSRALSPLKVDDSYQRIDTGELSRDQVVDCLERRVRGAQSD